MMHKWLTTLALTLAMLVVAGCNDAEHQRAKAEAKKKAAEAKQKEHQHDEWWCDEHGVPEDVCGQCSAKVAADLKKKGDWCAKHDRPDSQCFVCHPELEAKFAAQYEAKYGKKPPKPVKEKETGKS